MFKEIFSKPSIYQRVAVGKSAGFILGLIFFFLLPMVWEDAPMRLQWGVLLWYTTMGAFIGLFSVMTDYPLFNLRFSWWFRGIWIGGWMNFILSLIAYDTFAQMMPVMMDGAFAGMSPYWVTAEGAIAGLIMAFFTQKYAGEGTENL